MLKEQPRVAVKGHSYCSCDCLHPEDCDLGNVTTRCTLPRFAPCRRRWRPARVKKAEEELEAADDDADAAALALEGVATEAAAFGAKPAAVEEADEEEEEGKEEGKKSKKGLFGGLKKGKKGAAKKGADKGAVALGVQLKATKAASAAWLSMGNP